MNSSHVVAVRDLPPTVRDVLNIAGFHKMSISVEASETFQMRSAYGNGYRAFCIVMNLESGTHHRIDGSFGGPNPFERSPVDNDQTKHEIPVNGAAILGQEGGNRPTSATLIVRPDQITKLLPPSVEITERARSILRVTRGYTSAGRKEEFKRMNVTDAEIDSLVTRGLLAKNKAGALFITIQGKNAAGAKF